MFHEKPSSTAKVVNDHYSRLPTPIVRSLFPILVAINYLNAK